MRMYRHSAWQECNRNGHRALRLTKRCDIIYFSDLIQPTPQSFCGCRGCCTWCHNSLPLTIVHSFHARLLTPMKPTRTQNEQRQFCSVLVLQCQVLRFHSSPGKRLIAFSLINQLALTSAIPGGHRFERKIECDQKWAPFSVSIALVTVPSHTWPGFYMG